MDTESFVGAYRTPRKRANCFYRHAMWRRLVYSDGVKECLETGLYWLMDIVGNECVKPVLDSSLTTMATLQVDVLDGRASLRIDMQSDTPPVWMKCVRYTDMPDGRWTFLLAKGDVYREMKAILPTET